MNTNKPHKLNNIKRLISCVLLGDADVAYLAGAKYRKTDKSEMMGLTTVFSAAGVDKKKFLHHNGKTHLGIIRTFIRTFIRFHAVVKKT